LDLLCKFGKSGVKIDFMNILTFVNAAGIYFWSINSVILKYSKLQNKSKIKKF